MKSAAVSAIAVLGMAGAGQVVTGLDKIVHPPQPPAGLEAHESHASASLLGQFRTNVSAWLWVRTDLYLHNGVQMRPMTDDEVRSGVASNSPVDDGHEQLSDESAVVTVIPPKERDFRGIFGDIERLTDTYKDMRHHTHNDPKLAMPLFRLMTWIDPEFIPGWTTGAMVLARDKGTPAQLLAVNYLLDGLKENPKSVAILADLGHLQVSHLHNMTKAVEYFEMARALGRPHFHELSEMDDDALRQAYRWLGICYRDLGDKDRQRAVLREGLRIYRDDGVLLGLYCPPPTVLTQKGKTLWFEQLAAEIKTHGEPELH